MLSGIAQLPVQGSTLVPLPEDIFDNQDNPNPIMDLTHRTVAGLGNQAPEIPDELEITNEKGSISYNQENNCFLFSGSEECPIRLRTDSGSDILAPSMEVNLSGNTVTIAGPMQMYQDDVLIKGKGGGSYNWKEKQTTVNKVAIKVSGLLVRGDSIEYATDTEGKEYITVTNAYVTTEDVEKPSVWLGTGTLTIYPGDYGKVSHLSIATSEDEYTIPVLGWFTFSHSLNPREGYLPGAGTRSDWGAYLENSYGILFGNRRVEGIMPTADYLATLHLDARIRRGLAAGLDLEDISMTKKHDDMKGFASYFAQDSNPMINPLDTPRQSTNHQRYYASLKALWDVTPDGDTHGEWQLTSNINVVSDRYMLRDFLPEISRVEDKPDNTVRLLRKSDSTQSMIYTRFAPNDYYMTDERLEASFYRVRSALGKSGINYETNSSASIMRQYLPTEMRLDYQARVDNLKDESLKEYYTRLMNTESFFRVNTTHEFTTNFTFFNFLNATPKAGGAYTGYYDVGGIGSDNRFLGYLGCDFNLKFHGTYPDFQLKSLGMKGLTHVIQPYANYSQGSISSSNKYVPQIDAWSSTRGGGTTSPIPMDLSGYTGIDGWGNWHIWRLGVKNTLSTRVDNERRNFLSWDSFVDYNIDNPNSSYRFSNLYNVIRFNPSKRLEFYSTIQTPTINNGEGFSQYSIGARLIPYAWLETYCSFRTISDHPTQKDSEQLKVQANVRINEKYTVSTQWYYDITKGRMPIQQYTVFRNSGAWYIGTTFFIRDNGGKKEQGLGISFTLGETGTALPINLF